MTKGSSILSARERALLFDPPSDPDLLQRRYVLDPDDMALIARCRRAHNRLGFAVQLALVHDLGRPLRPGEELSAALVDIIADQVNISPAVFGLYGRRDETRREHIAEIAAALNLRTIRQSDYRGLIVAAAEGAAATDHGVPIVGAVLNRLKRLRVIVPGHRLIERLALVGRSRARRHAWSALVAGFDATIFQSLDHLLTTRPDGLTWHGWLNDVPEGARLKTLQGIVERLDALRSIGLDDAQRSKIHAHRYGVLAREARIIPARQIRQFAPTRRRATLTAFVIERRAALTDLAIDTADRMIGSVRRAAQTKRQERVLAQANGFTDIARIHRLLGRALLGAREDGRDLAAVINQAVGWNVLAYSVAAADDLLGLGAGDGIDELIGRYTSLRRVSTILLAAFVFRSFRATDPTLTAIDLLRDLHTGRLRSLPARPPIIFLRRKWRSRIRQADGRIDRQAYEVAVLVHLRDKLRSGDIWVDGSRAYRTFEDYLLPTARFADLQAQGRLGLAVPDDLDAWLRDRAARLDAKLAAVSRAAEADLLPDAAITADGLSVKPIRRDARDEAKALSECLYALLPRVRITELLAEVNTWTGFLDQFGHFGTGVAPTDEAALMGAILADATNLGLERMAESSRGVTIHRLNLMVDRHIRPDTYTKAIAAIVDAQQAHPFATIWGSGEASSSDGQFFPAGGRREAAADYNARYGKKPGAVFYGHISDRFASFYSKVIPASASEAPHVLDGLLHHESSVDIREHATDTAGAVEIIFAMFHLFGFRFAPRMRGLADRRLYIIDRNAHYGPIQPLIGGVVDVERIRDHWQDVLRLAASIRTGAVVPSVILNKIAAFPRQNALNKSLREIGRIERAIFTCDWLLDADLRRRSNGNLNKGESRHALARAVFFHQLGELRDRTAEATAHRASGLNLVVNAIILWNTTYLSRAVDFVRSQSVDLPDERLAHVAPVRWGHIALTGDYLWGEIENPRERFRPLRTRRFDPRGFKRP